MSEASDDEQRPAIVVCTSCRSDTGIGGTALADALAQEIAASDLSRQVKVARVECLNACAKPISLALTGEARAVYVFNRIDPLEDGRDILATVKAWLDAPNGQIEDATLCGRLRFCLSARIPVV